MHRTTDRFWRCFRKLPLAIQKMAEDSFELLKNDPSHPSLHFKKVGKFWSARVSIGYRAMAYEDGEDLIWVWIGTHDDYMRMISF
ncbi:MAG: hypothetical protein HQK61_06180 [Desulfamplus sp.]|nr:hypothetical protein [Desulfamplus sp.]